MPNGNRTYFCTRSQPPVFVLMVELLAGLGSDSRIVQRYLPQLRREYDFWMSGADELATPGRAHRRVVKVEGGFLNRYWDDSAKPRPESFAEDLELANASDRDAAGLFRSIRAACESGWDFSSRWLGDRTSTESIRTTEMLPVDLNSLMFKLESVLAQAYGSTGDRSTARTLAERAEQRRKLLRTQFFDDKSGFFMDLAMPELVPTQVFSLAAAWPLFFEIALPAQAKSVADRMHGEFLAPGGWMTTLHRTGEQWDRPNGWTPLHWVAWIGLGNYGYDAQAVAGASRWVENNRAVYRSTGKLLEKYDVESVGTPAGGGEYLVQDGFGWTNAILLRFLSDLRRRPHTRQS